MLVCVAVCLWFLFSYSDLHVLIYNALSHLQFSYAFMKVFYNTVATDVFGPSHSEAFRTFLHTPWLLVRSFSRVSGTHIVSLFLSPWKSIHLLPGKKSYYHSLHSSSDVVFYFCSHSHINVWLVSPYHYYHFVSHSPRKFVPRSCLSTSLVSLMRYSVLKKEFISHLVLSELPPVCCMKVSPEGIDKSNANYI